ncbi:MFS transporter [Friedmanniella luteola]|uniref:MFS transporter n=1 Tax=Friedmanniella luteola TaxID=546871 RepID=UPI000B89706D|nr:MFS transporter [Friedmanniella luteola]
MPAAYGAGDPAVRRASLALFLAGVAVFALLYSTQPLLPELSRWFGVSAAASTLTVSLTTLTLAVGLLVAGPLSERFGRTRLVTLSLVAATLLGVACAAAPTWGLLLAARSAQGLALAGLPAVAVAYLNEELDGAVAGQAIGLYVGGNALGGMVGRLLAGALADLGGWRLAVGGIAVLGAACTAAVVVLLPPSRRFVAAQPGLETVARSARAVLTDPVLLGLYLLAALLMGAFVAVFNALGFRLEAPPYALSAALAGLVFLVYAFGSVASTTAGRLADRHGRRAVVPVAVVVMLAGLLGTAASPLVLVVLALAVMTVGFFAAHGVASGWVAARARAGGRATAQAASTYLFAYYVGSSVVGAAAGRAWTSSGWTGVLVLTAALVVLGCGVALLLARSTSLLQPGNPPVGG